MKVFPTCIFSFETQEFDIEGQRISGGESLAGIEDEIATDGGGHVYAQYGGAYLDERAIALAWSALSGYLGDGAPIIFPICDAKHQPTNGSIGVPHGDGSPFSDESEYESADCEATLASAAALRATTIAIDVVATGLPIIGGEWLSIDHVAMRHRAYKIIEIVSTVDTVTTVKIRPPLREATDAGVEIELADPRCVMKLAGGMPAPRTNGFAEGASVRLVEDFSGSYT